MLVPEMSLHIFLHMLRMKEVPNYIYFGFYSFLRFQSFSLPRCLGPECLSNSSVLRNKWVDASVLTSRIDSAPANGFLLETYSGPLSLSCPCLPWG